MNRQNDVLMQYFEWYLPDNGTLWKQVKEDAKHLCEIGINNVWLPPAFKATGTNDVGYGVYDLFDLGEFNQKGTVRTKYGTKEEYIEAIQSLKENGIRPIADIVLNHKAGGDEKERFNILKMDPDNRQHPISQPYEIEGYTHFTFPGRNKKYSKMEWHWYHFSGLDYDASRNETGIFMVLGDNKGWADNQDVDDEKGNFDYLMFNDIDYSHPEVLEEIEHWVEWFIQTTGIEGFRLDAIKHIDRKFMGKFINVLEKKLGDEFYVFGEYWNEDYEIKLEYLKDVNYEFDLVDVKLHMNFHRASIEYESYDLTTILDNTLMYENPWNAVTFVENHDSQKGQALESPVEEWFRPAAYAIILLINEGLPCIFYGDYYGIQGDYSKKGCPELIDKLLYLRQKYAYGEMEKYFDHPNCIGWTRLGDNAHPGKLATVISNSDNGWKEMFVGLDQKGKTYVDYLGYSKDKVIINENGIGRFLVNSRSVSVWVDEESLNL